jgi:hypothetical protein
MPRTNKLYQQWLQEEQGHLEQLYCILLRRLGKVTTFEDLCRYIYLNSRNPHLA